MLTWSHVPLATEGFHPCLPPKAGGIVEARKNIAACVCCTPVAFIDAQSFQRADRSRSGGVFKRNRTGCIEVAVTDDTISALRPATTADPIIPLSFKSVLPTVHTRREIALISTRRSGGCVRVNTLQHSMFHTWRLNCAQNGRLLEGG